MLTRETATALPPEANAHARSHRHVHVRRRVYHHFLPDVDDVVAMTAEIGLAAHDAGQNVVETARLECREQLEIVGLHANVHRVAPARELAAADFQSVA